MDQEIRRFLAAHATYSSLIDLRTGCRSPQEREQVHIEILRAYLAVQYQARVISGLQEDEGMQFAEAN